MLLAIDTATRWASIALYDGERVWGEETWYSRDNHTVELMPRLVRLLVQQKVNPEMLTGLAVTRGPGSFTGLRIGLSVAKGMALALEIPIVGVPTLDVLARAWERQTLPVCAVVQAGRGRVCAAFYVRRRGKWRKQGEDRLTTWELLSEEVTRRTLFCGEIDVQAAQLLRERLGEHFVLAPPAASLRRAGYLAELGWERLHRGESDDLDTLSPLYLHQPVEKQA